jgi:cytochrome c oxidase subunit IV
MTPHVVPLRTYFAVFGTLMVCTALTIAIAFVDLPFGLNAVAALAIALFKATLIALFFMHVKYGSRLTAAVIGGSVFWFAILVALTMGDYLTRSWRTYG